MSRATQLKNKLILLSLAIALTTLSFNNVATYPSHTHCAKKEMSDKYKSEIRLRVYYKKNSSIGHTHAYGTHGSTDPIDDSSDAPHEDPGADNTYCYPVQQFNNHLTDVEKIVDFRIDVKHAGDCKNWNLSKQIANVPGDIDNFTDGIQSTGADQYQYDASTQTYALRHYHFGVHTHCKLRGRTYATTN